MRAAALGLPSYGPLFGPVPLAQLALVGAEIEACPTLASIGHGFAG